MINVKCPRCKEAFEVPASLAGQQETCPVCEHAVVIPPERPSPPKQSIWKKDIFGRTAEEFAEERDELPPSVGRTFGCLSTVAGIIVTVFAMGMDVTGGHIEEIGAVANLDKMNQRPGLIVIGVGLFVSGIVALSMDAIHVMMWRIQHDRRAKT